MSETEMKAAKFEVVERYQEAKKTLAVLEMKLHNYGDPLRNLGNDLANSGRPSGSYPKIDLHEVANTLESHAAAIQTLAKAKAEMESIGMTAF